MHIPTAIDIKNLSKRFQINPAKSMTFRESVSSKFQLHKKPQKSQNFWALKDINLKVLQGESIGIIGRNGAGKSTLLKILSRITKPTRGRIELIGRTSSLLEVGTGFHPELTGRDNIYLNGTILGMKRKEITQKLPEIIEFSGVSDFINTPVKHYSSGMKVRLAFSVAAHLDPDILIIDEVLAVGDAEFQKKCLGAMGSAVQSGRTVLFVSHNMGAVAQLCKRAVVLDQGQLGYDGSSDEAIRIYSESMNQVQNYESPTIPENKSIHITKVKLGSDQNSSNNLAHDEPIHLNIYFNTLHQIRGLNICISVFNYLQSPIFTSDIPLPRVNSGAHKAEVVIPPNTLKAGSYSFLVAIHDPSRGAGAVEYLQYICPMHIFDNGSEFAKYEGVWKTGDVFVECHWNFNESDD